MRNYIFLMLILVASACEQDLPTAREFPIIKTLPISNIDETGALFRAEVLQEGKTETTSFGFVWNIREPNIETSSKIILGEKLDRGFFEKRIDYSHSKGLEYKIRAFATYSDKTVYGNTITFTSKGSAQSKWSLEMTDIHLEGVYPYGSSNNSNGLVLFASTHFYAFNPKLNSFSLGSSLPESGYSNRVPSSTSIGDTYYFINGGNRNLYRFENGDWSVESIIPFDPGVFLMYYHLHSSHDKIYILSSSESYMYDLKSKSWETKSVLPISYGYSVKGISLNSKAYIITSDKNIWEYDEGTDHWTIKTTYPGRVSEYMVSFTYNNRIYFGLSRPDHENGWMDTELWSYDPNLDNWELQELFPTRLIYGNSNLFYFFLNEKLYIGHGKPLLELYDIWMYDPSKK